jgi:hypothetical protein
MRRGVIAAPAVVAVAAWLFLPRNRLGFEEERTPAQTPASAMPLAVRPSEGTAEATAQAGTSAVDVSAALRAKIPRAWDREAVIVFPDGSEVRLTLRRIRTFESPLPWPDRLIDQYEALRQLADAGEPSAAIALHNYLSMCQDVHEDEASLERAVDRLHREGVLERAGGTVGPGESFAGGDLTQVEYSHLRGPYEVCRGITPEHKAQLLVWSERAAEAGDPGGLMAWARSLGETKAGLAAWEKAWSLGVRGAIAPLATLYERGVPGVADGQPDYARAYAFRLISLKLHEAWYGERPSRAQRDDLASIEEHLRRTGGFLTPPQQAQAVQLAKELLEQNRNCCSGVWPGVW